MSEDWEISEWELFERDAETIMKEIKILNENKNKEEDELMSINDLFNSPDKPATKINNINNKIVKSIKPIKKNTHKFIPTKNIKPINKKPIKRDLSDYVEDEHLVYCCDIADRILNK
jgi:hypothetical protein